MAQQPPLFTDVLVVPEIGEIYTAQIERILGQYIYVGSTGRFHWLDDRIGPNKWAANSNIYIIQNV